MAKVLSEKGDEQVVQLLLQHGAKCMTPYKQTPFFVFVREGELPQVKGRG
jgi:hypothetical protein